MEQSRLSLPIWSTACNASSSSVDLGAPRMAPCSFPCSTGTFYSPASLSCQACLAPTISTTTRTIFGQSWPVGFGTYCTPSPCDVWHVSANGAFLHSGNQSIGQRVSLATGLEDNTVRTFLIGHIHVHYPGAVLIFTYRVESEPTYQGLAFTVNGTRYGSGPRTLLGSGVQHTWSVFSLALPVGVSEVIWSYEKDNDENSDDPVNVGLDRAYIRDIIVVNGQVPSECDTCPGGYIPLPTSDGCTACGVNTYATVGNASCSACPGNFVSPVGSSQCVAPQPCPPQRYSLVLGTCYSNGTQTIAYTPRTTSCTPTAPRQQVIACQQCSHGTMWNTKTGTCVSCPLGYFLNTTTFSCGRCAPGLIPARRLTYDDFAFVANNLSSLFSSIGLCEADLSPDSNFTSPHIVVMCGRGMNATADTTLALTVNFTDFGSVTFRYYILLPPTFEEVPPSVDETNLRFFIDDDEYTLGTTVVYPSVGTFTSRVYSPGIRNVTWTFYKYYTDVHNTGVLFVLDSIDVLGAERGRATECLQCVAGTYCPANASTMTPCSVGTFTSSPGSVSCLLCPLGTVSGITPGATTCSPCSLGTFPDALSSTCVSNCTFTALLGAPQQNFTYDLTPLRSTLFGPLLTATSESFSFQLCIRRTVCGNGFACQSLSDNRTSSLGSWMSFVPNGYSGLTLRYTQGDPCTKQRSRSANVVLRCHQTMVIPRTLFVTESPPCTFNFEILTLLACPLCTNASYTNVTSQCQPDNTKTTSWTKTGEARLCLRGAPPPSPVVEVCNLCQASWYTTTWSACGYDGYQEILYQLNDSYVGCEENKYVKVPERRQCLEQEVVTETNEMTIATLVLIFVSVAVGFGYQYKSFLMETFNAMSQKLGWNRI